MKLQQLVLARVHALNQPLKGGKVGDYKEKLEIIIGKIDR